MMITITKKQARQFLINYHGIHKTMKSDDDILAYIKKVGCIQFDPVNVAGRNHDLVLQARVKGYKPEDCYQLLYEDRQLVDGLDKNMSIYPVEDWQHLKRLRESVSNWRKIKKGEYTEAVEQVREVIRQKGPVSSKDLKMDKKIDWFWSKAHVGKAVLETLFFHGILIVARKEKNLRYFDYASKHIPHAIYQRDDPNTSLEDYHDWHLKRRINSIGLLWNKRSDAFLGMIDFKTPERNRSFERHLDEKEIVKVQVEDIHTPFYISSENMEQLEASKKDKSKASFIAPLDNLMWDRNLVSTLFDFEYTWEIYKPAEKRQFGYYVLPVIYRDKFIARFEPKRESKINQLTIKNWWWEPGVRKSDKMYREIHNSLEAFREFLGMKELAVECEI